MSNWFANFSQIPMKNSFMTEEDMRTILYPKAELGVHIAFKLVETGSIIGGWIVAPLWPYLRPKSKLSQRTPLIRMGICGKRGMLIGLIATPIMETLFIKKKQIDEDGLIDRCYRLRYNKKQLTVDRSALVGFVIGWGLLKWPGIVMCTNISVFVATAYNALLFDRMRKYKLLGGDQMEEPDPNYKPKKL